MEEVFANPTDEGISASNGRRCVWGYTLEDIYIIVVYYEEIEEDAVRVITAYEVPEPH